MPSKAITSLGQYVKRTIRFSGAQHRVSIQVNLSSISQKPYQVHIADDINFYKLYTYLKQHHTHSYFFESLSHPRHQDRYHTIGFDPAVILTAKGPTLTLSGPPANMERFFGVKGQTEFSLELDNPYNFLQTNFKFDHFATAHQGGLVGYFSHDAMNYFEKSIQVRPHENFATFKLGLYLDGLLYDTTRGSLYYYTYDQDRSDQVRQYIKDSQSFETPRTLDQVLFLGNSVSKEEFIGYVNKTKDKIRRGFSFQAEVGFKSQYNIQGDKIAIYDLLREINPSPYMYYVNFGDETLLGASPEILVSCRNGHILTTPTAGTTTRGQTPEEDTRLARALLNDPKEIAEHNMLVDLHRNDIARVARTGSVRIDDLMYIIKFSHVQHIVSNVVGDLAEGKDAYDALSTILPGGVVTGAPKIETVKIIEENESLPRGPYGGAVGRFSLSGDCDFCLPLRSIFCYKDDCYAQTCAGIVYDSQPEKEYSEVISKLAAMKQTLEKLGAKNA